MVDLKGSEQARTMANPYIQAINDIAKNLPKPPPKDKLQDSLQLTASALEFLFETVGPREILCNLIKTRSPTELSMFYHEVLCLSPKSTLLKTIKNE